MIKEKENKEEETNIKENIKENKNIMENFDNENKLIMSSITKRKKIKKKKKKKKKRNTIIGIENKIKFIDKNNHDNIITIGKDIISENSNGNKNIK